MLLTIAGSSGSGKTTAVRACARAEGLVVHDFDEIGVPPGADTACASAAWTSGSSACCDTRPTASTWR